MCIPFIFSQYVLTFQEHLQKASYNQKLKYVHGSTKDAINPAYHTITDHHIKRLTEEPINYYAEVKKTPDKDVKMTPNPAYAVR